MNHGFFRVAAATVPVRVASPAENAEEILKSARELASKGVGLAVFPEMSITGYTCGDLFHNMALLNASDRAIERLARESVQFPGMAMVVGAPVRRCGALYNCAVVISGGHVEAIIPKTYLPNYNEFYEQRWFSAAGGVGGNTPNEMALPGNPADGTLATAPFGNNLLLDFGNGAVAAVELCEDLWAPIPPSTYTALAGANILLNLSASNDLVGKYAYLTQLIAQQSARTMSAYVYASAGPGESSTDLVFDGKAFVAENGTMLAATPRWKNEALAAVADVDLEAINRDRMHNGTFAGCARRNSPAGCCTRIAIKLARQNAPEQLLRKISPTPFVPVDKDKLQSRASEILNIQAAGLAQRLHAIKCRSLVVGISGGLDSTLALLVATLAFDRLGLPRQGITGITMPGFGTTGRTYRNAINLMEGLGVTIREINISAAVRQHFADIGHDETNHDVTYENSQARERTQILMDVANQTGGLVLGTGDLSELALGWATYNGDQMSMYGVNASIPKTLVKYLVERYADECANTEVANTLRDIIDTPISPELIPADNNGNIVQRTEDIVGPYELHDFFLYHMLRHGFGPAKIFLLARHAFMGVYSSETILHWMRIFYRRFFSQQFKRSCMPDGPKVGSVCLSPRGDWRMPSDASSALWLTQINELQANELQ